MSYDDLESKYGNISKNAKIKEEKMKIFLECQQIKLI